MSPKLIIYLRGLHKDIQVRVEVSPLSNFNYSFMTAMDSKKLWKCLCYDGLDFKKGKRSVDMCCNNICLSNCIHMNLFHISIVWKCNSKWQMITFRRWATYGYHAPPPISTKLRFFSPGIYWTRNRVLPLKILGCKPYFDDLNRGTLNMFLTMSRNLK